MKIPNLKYIILSVSFLIKVIYAKSQFPHPELKLFAPGIISTDQIESGPVTLTEDGKTIYFTVQAPGHNFSVLCESSLTDSIWSQPKILPFSGKFVDEHPFLSHDGKKLFFSSNRPLSEKSNIPKDHDIWMIERTNGDWGKPFRLGDSINTMYPEFSPCLTFDNTLYFTRLSPPSTRGGEIYYARTRNSVFMKYKRVENDSINSRLHEWHVYVTGDEKYMFYTTLDKPGGRGGEDLFVSYNKDGSWQNPFAFPYNDRNHDYLASLSPDGSYFYFISEKESVTIKRPVTEYKDFIKSLRAPGNGRSDIYYVEFKQLLKQLYKSG